MASYIIMKGSEYFEFKSESEACRFLGVSIGAVASAYRNGRLCKGYIVQKGDVTYHGKSSTRLYDIWRGMKERCYRPKHLRFGKYGGRGISICDEWRNSFEVFEKWAINNGYNESLTIERIDVNGNYEPNNCRWATNKEQQNNKQNNRRITWNDETKTLAEWSEIVGIKKTTLKERLNAGWDVEAALTTPVKRRTRGYRPST